MDPSKIDKNLNFQRAMMLLEKRIEDPSYLIAFWRVMGDHYGKAPWPEKCTPWFKGLEKELFN